MLFKFIKSITSDVFSDKNVFIHIGINKTGSTALQNCFSKNSAALKDFGVLYPVTGRVHGAHYCFSSSLGFRNPNSPREWMDSRADLFKSMVAEINSSGCDNIILSSEDFILRGDVDGLKHFFSGFNVKIIVYLRRHDFWWSSAYAQAVKMVQNPPWGIGPRSFIRFNQKGVEPYHNYRWLVDRYANSFGSENILVRPYEKTQNSQGLAFDFLQSIDLLPPDFDLIKITDDNRSTSAKTILLTDVIHRLSACAETKKKLYEAACLYSGDDLQVVDLISPGFRLELIENNIRDYEYVAKNFLGRSDCNLFFDNLPEENKKWEVPFWPTPVFMGDLIIRALTD